MIIPVLPHTPLSTKLNNSHNLRYYIVIGANQPRSIEKIILNIIYLLPRPEEPYLLIYVNTLAHKDAYNDFMKVTEFLPIEYFKHLCNIVVLQASFLNKARGWISFDTVTSFVKNKTEYCSEFKELAESVMLNSEELLNLLPESIKKELGKE